jgi:hypothetical protein
VVRPPLYCIFSALLDFLSLFLVFNLFLVCEVLLKEEENFVFVSSFHGLLKSEHLVAHVVTNLDGFVLVLEFFTRSVFKNGLAHLVCALVFLTPLLVVFNFREEHQLFAVMATYLKYLDKLFQDVRAWSYSKLTRALKRTILLPLGDTPFAEQLPAIVALHGLDWYFKANAANQGVLQLLVHLAVQDSLNVIATGREAIVLRRLGGLTLFFFA